MSEDKVVQIATAKQFKPKYSAQVVFHPEANSAIEATADNDGWFISFAQATVDRMLKRYGIQCSSEDTRPEEFPTITRIAA